MNPNERLVSGLRCSEVLALLSEFLDGDLPGADLVRVRGHVAGCEVCESFGARFAAVVAAVRGQLREPEPLDADVAARLASALADRR